MLDPEFSGTMAKRWHCAHVDPILRVIEVQDALYGAAEHSLGGTD